MDQEQNPRQRPEQYNFSSHIISILDSLLFLVTLLEIGYLLYSNYLAMEKPPQYTFGYIHPTLDLNLSNPVLEYGVLAPDFGDPTNQTKFIESGCSPIKRCYHYNGKTDAGQTIVPNASWSDVSFQSNNIKFSQDITCYIFHDNDSQYFSHKARLVALILQLLPLSTVILTGLLLYNNRSVPLIYSNRELINQSYRIIKYTIYHLIDCIVMGNLSYFNTFGPTCIQQRTNAYSNLFSPYGHYIALLVGDLFVFVGSCLFIWIVYRKYIQMQEIAGFILFYLPVFSIFHFQFLFIVCLFKDIGVSLTFLFKVLLEYITMFGCVRFCCFCPELVTWLITKRRQWLAYIRYTRFINQQQNNNLQPAEPQIPQIPHILQYTTNSQSHMRELGEIRQGRRREERYVD